MILRNSSSVVQLLVPAALTTFSSNSLHVFDVIEIETRDGQHLQIFDAGCFFPAAAAEGGITGLETPGDECSEAPSFFLEAADDLKMINALVERFPNAEHHGGSRPHA
jgi:hypothetical protein